MTSSPREELLGDHHWVADGGLETDLLFNRGADLPHFAAFPLVERDEGRRLLERYYRDYARIARQAGAGLVVEAPTWRANPDWAALLGYDVPALDVANRRAVELAQAIGARALDDGVERVVVGGVVGPRGDGYQAGGTDPDEAAGYHAAQVDSLAAAGVDVVHAMTMTGSAEAIGVVRAARAAGVPVAVSFTVETDGRLPDGTALARLAPSCRRRSGLVRRELCAPHPRAPRAGARPPDAGTGAGTGTGAVAGWQSGITVLRPNASTLTHAELDEMTELDTGDLDLLVSSARDVRRRLPGLQVLGGCCGTDARHVAALWGTASPA